MRLADLLVPIEQGIVRRERTQVARERRLRTLEAQRTYLRAFDEALRHRQGPVGDWLDEVARAVLCDPDDQSGNARRRR